MAAGDDISGVTLFEERGLDGLARIKRWMADGHEPPMHRLLGIKMVEANRGEVVAEATPTEAFLNPRGIVHGGYIATILDVACGCAVFSALPEDAGFTTLELKILYHRAISPRTGRIRAEGKLLSLGKRVGFSEAKLVDGSGGLLSSATSSLLIMPNPG